MIWTSFEIKIFEIHNDLLIIRKNTGMSCALSVCYLWCFWSIAVVATLFLFWYQHFDARALHLMPMACFATEASITIEFEFESVVVVVVVVVIIIVIVVWATLGAIDSIVLQRLSAPAIQTIVVISIHAVSLYGCLTAHMFISCRFSYSAFLFCAVCLCHSVFSFWVCVCVYATIHRRTITLLFRVGCWLLHLHHNNSISSVQFKTHCRIPIFE